MARLTTTPPPIRDRARRCSTRARRPRAPVPRPRPGEALRVGRRRAPRPRHRRRRGGAEAPRRAAPRPSSGGRRRSPCRVGGDDRRPRRPRSRPVPTARRRRRRGSWLWLLLVFLVAAGAGVAAYLVVRNETSGGSGGGGGSANASSLPPASEASFAVFDFDPFDSETVKQENRNLVGLAHRWRHVHRVVHRGLRQLQREAGRRTASSRSTASTHCSRVSVSTADERLERGDLRQSTATRHRRRCPNGATPSTSGTDVDTPHTFSVDPRGAAHARCSCGSPRCPPDVRRTAVARR